MWLTRFHDRSSVSTKTKFGRVLLAAVVFSVGDTGCRAGAGTAAGATEAQPAASSMHARPAMAVTRLFLIVSLLWCRPLPKIGRPRPRAACTAPGGSKHQE